MSRSTSTTRARRRASKCLWLGVACVSKPSCGTSFAGLLPPSFSLVSIAPVLQSALFSSTASPCAGAITAQLEVERGLVKKRVCAVVNRPRCICGARCVN